MPDLICRRHGAKSSTRGTMPALIAVVLALLPVSGGAQTTTPSSGATSTGSLISYWNLPDNFASTLQKMGGRMMDASVAQIALTGTTTDSNGSRAAQILIQAPGLMSYTEGTNVALAFDGTQFNTSGQVPSNQEAILESFLAHFPDSVCLQLASGGIWRRLGSHFKTVAGNPTNYTGPYWTVWAYSPAVRAGLTAGKALQQSLYIALDESNWLIAEVRVVTKSASGPPTVVETQFNNWVQQNGQWCPGQIVRLEGGKQTLSFQTAQCTAGPAAAAATFKP